MAKINGLNEIDEIIIHWSESKYINDVLGHNIDFDIEKKVDVLAFDSIIKHAAGKVGIGCDKTSMSIKLKTGLQWCYESKFHLTRDKDGLLSLINAGQ